MAHTGRTAQESRLYWSEDGQVMCGRHAPYRGSDTWVYGRWQAVGPTLVRKVVCETCDYIARRKAVPA